VSAGLRYEYVSAPKEVEDRIDYLYGADTDNYEPRVAAAWMLPNADGFLKWLTGSQAGSASLRGGYGRTDGRISSRCSPRTAPACARTRRTPSF